MDPRSPTFRGASLRASAARAALAVLLCWPLAGAAAGPKVDKKPDLPPEVVTSVAGQTEIGTIAGAPYRIDVPAAWNHSLVIYFHGYGEHPMTFKSSLPMNEVAATIVRKGYAVAQSAYSTAGWALAEGVPETEELRQYFIKKYGKVNEIIGTGSSMGGALLMQTMEQNPKPYAGALELCGAVGPSYEAFERRFAWRAAFDFYFPGVMPPLVPAPLDYEESEGTRGRIAAVLRGNPAAAAQMRNLTGLHTDADLVHLISYVTFVLADMAHRAGGNPFDNRNYLYTGTNAANTLSDDLLNDGVKRYAADPGARKYLVDHYTPSGRMTKPMLALHTTYDPLIPATTLALYGHEVEEAGFGNNLVQQYVHRDGHCAFSPAQVGESFDELMGWIHSGRRPTPGLLK